MKSQFKKHFAISGIIIAAVTALLCIFCIGASAAAPSVIIPMTSCESASKYLGIFTNEDVSGISHKYGENVGSYAFEIFDENESALLIKKSSNDYMGSHFRFHLKKASSFKFATSQSWMVVKYKTNTTNNASMMLINNGSTSDKAILANDVSVSDGEWVYTAPVNLNAGGSLLFSRLRNSKHIALVVNLPENTDNSVYFYIKEIAFFTSEAEALAHTGGKPSESTSEPHTTVIELTDIKGTSSFVGDYYTYKGFTIPTSLWVPSSYDANKEYALLIYFHGSGGRGNSPRWSTGNGNDITKNIIKKYGDEVIIFAPRCPTTYRWAEASWTSGIYNYYDTPISQPMGAVLSYIHDVILANYSIDESRIYATGDSMGGGGTWDLMLRDPELLAAALPIAGYNDPTMAANIREDLKLWIVHTAQDKSVNVAGDRASYAVLKNLGRDVRYTEYDSSNSEHKKLFDSSWEESSNWEHWAWVPAHNDMQMIDWLMSQKKSAGDKKVSAFTDVDTSDSYYSAVSYAADAGLFTGTSDTTFSPDDPMTRAMFVTVLGRLAKVDVSAYATPTFTDVEPGKWYTPYVQWAAANGIVNGYTDGSFGINDPITVEQAIVILNRYTEGKNAECDTGIKLSARTDASSVSSYAKDAMQWALSSGVYMGRGKLLGAAEHASRALVASMFYNYSLIFG